MSFYKPHTTFPTELPDLSLEREDEPSLLDKIDIVFYTDPEVEGKKQGIANASRVYVPILGELKKQYEMLDEFAQKSKEQNDTKIQEQFDLLESLEQKKADLENKRKEKIECASQKFGVPVAAISASFAEGNSYPDFQFLPGIILDYFYHRKMKEIAEYESKYFKKTVIEVWEPKVKELKEKLENLRTEVAQTAKEYADLFVKTAYEINEIIRQISELEILLEMKKG